MAARVEGGTRDAHAALPVRRGQATTRSARSRPLRAISKYQNARYSSKQPFLSVRFLSHLYFFIEKENPRLHGTAVRIRSCLPSPFTIAK